MRSTRPSRTPGLLTRCVPESTGVPLPAQPRPGLVLHGKGSQKLRLITDPLHAELRAGDIVFTFVFNSPKSNISTIYIFN